MIKGKIIGLRAIEKADLPLLLEWRNTEENRKYFREWRELNTVHQENWFQKHVMDNVSPVMFAIEHLTEYYLLGACGLTYIDWIHRIAEVSIYIGRGYIDEVYCPEALDLLTEYAFGVMGLHKIWIGMYEYDVLKRKLAENRDFVHEGTLKEVHFHGGKWYDELLYGKVSNV